VSLSLAVDDAQSSWQAHVSRRLEIESYFGMNFVISMKILSAQ